MNQNQNQSFIGMHSLSWALLQFSQNLDIAARAANVFCDGPVSGRTQVKSSQVKCIYVGTYQLFPAPVLAGCDYPTP